MLARARGHTVDLQILEIGLRHTESLTLNLEVFPLLL